MIKAIEIQKSKFVIFLCFHLTVSNTPLTILHGQCGRMYYKFLDSHYPPINIFVYDRENSSGTAIFFFFFFFSLSDEKKFNQSEVVNLHVSNKY